MRTLLGFLLLFASLGAPGCATQTATNGNAGAANSNAAAGQVLVYTYEVVNTYPHDPAAFTQGLIFQDGALSVSHGLFPEKGSPGNQLIENCAKGKDVGAWVHFLAAHLLW